VLCGPQTGSEGSLIEEVRAHGVPLTILPDLLREISPAHDLLALARMARLMRARRCDIVHTHSSKAGILGRIAARLAGVPVIVHTVHGWSFHDHMSTRVRRTYILLERMAASFTRAMIVVTHRDIDKGLREGIGRPEQYRLIRSAIPLEEFDLQTADRARTRQALGLPLNVPVLGNVGPRSEEPAGLGAGGRASAAFAGCRFLLVGDTAAPQVEALLQAEGIATGRCSPACGATCRRCWRHGRFPAHSLWKACRAPFPGLAMQVPVVASRVDGTAEAIQDGDTGSLCDPADLDGLAYNRGAAPGR
jgi:glycosyltransferase involved in cell wall biosynthesis